MSYIKKTRTYFKGSYVKKEDRVRLLAIGKCMYCGGSELLQIEHILACKNGGTSEIENLTVSCNACNAQKGSFTMDVFLARVIMKRDKVFNSVFSYTSRLSRHKARGTQIDLQNWLILKIKECRVLHSYYTRIIHSVFTGKYIINGKNQNR